MENSNQLVGVNKFLDLYIRNKYLIRLINGHYCLSKKKSMVIISVKYNLKNPFKTFYILIMVSNIILYI